MKKFLTLILACAAFSASFAQSEKYVKAMEALVPSIDTTMNREALTGLANSFERIASAEKTQWLPYYYAALAYIRAGYTYAMDGSFGDKSTDIDPIADKAEQLLNKADELNKNNTEVWVVKKMLASLRLMANPMVRYMEYGAIATAALEMAKKLNEENPRIYLLEGQDLFFTPEQFGGDKEEAKKRFEKAVSKFGTYKPESSIHPNWGLRDVNYFLSQVK
jgi:tetratricopeptide (TPR) repeat protein